MMTISEGATIAGGDMVLSGEEDAYGHRKLGGIGARTGQLIKEKTGEGIVYQQLAYLMRSGSPDSLDLMVATNYAAMAADFAIEGIVRAHDRAPFRHLHQRADLGDQRRCEEGRRGRVVRRARLPADGPPRRR